MEVDGVRRLPDKAAHLRGARSDFNAGAWLAARGVAGYAPSSWPQRDDMSAIRRGFFTSGADALAREIVEDELDGMAARAKTPRGAGPGLK